MKRFFSHREMARLLDLPETRIRNWARIGLVPHSGKRQGQLLFDFRGVVALRTLSQLLDQGVSIQRIRKCVETLRQEIPDVGEPLSEIRVYALGDQIVLRKDNLTFTPDGQLMIDFREESSPVIPMPLDPVEPLFARALGLEEDGQWDEAKETYEAVLSLNPCHTDALVNIGNILYRKGLAELAGDKYSGALEIDPDHVEANYNLANLLEEAGDLEEAVLFFRRSLRSNPGFAEAHYNLARVLEKIGKEKAARKHWRKYSELSD
jgi:tetratricopeptide (TPR) repeat protein